MNKSMLYLLISFYLLSSCATTSVTTFKKKEISNPFSSVLVICIENNLNIKNLDSLNYNNHIRGSFNSFENMKYRKHLEKTIKRNLSPNGFPNIFTSGEMFKLDEDYTYEEFILKVEDSGCQSILLINLNNYWSESSYVTHHYDNSSFTSEQTEPNFEFYCNLFNSKNGGKYLWTSNIVAKGIYAGYDTLNNHMARRLSKKLKKDKMIY